MGNDNRLLYDWRYEDTKNRSPIWYMVALSLSIGLVIWGFLTRQYGMSIVVMLAGGFFYFLENNSEDVVHVEVSELGINIQENFYDYSKISGFSLIYNGSNAVFLRLLIKKRGISVLNVKVDNTVASNIRPILANYVEENEKGEVSFGEKLMHLLKL